MKENLLHILQEADERTEAMLHSYINGNLSEADQIAFEAQLASDPMLRDALEGLRQVKQPKRIAQVSAQLNKLILKRLQQKNRKKQALPSPLQIALVALVMLLAIMLIAYLMVDKLQRG